VHCLRVVPPVCWVVGWAIVALFSVFWWLCAVFIICALNFESEQSIVVSLSRCTVWCALPASRSTSLSARHLSMPVMIVILSLGWKCVAAVIPYVSVGGLSLCRILIMSDIAILNQGEYWVLSFVLRCTVHVLPSAWLTFQWFHWLSQATVWGACVRAGGRGAG
jgi:hypothetical protein